MPFLGLFAAIFGFVPAGLGVVFGHIGLSRAKQLNGIGRSQAIAGLATGYVTVALIVLVTLFWLIAMMTSAIADPYYY
ncbi:DUF4190 domain-containing protein [Paramicrobacterium agarici]|uniref:DUF4190 domain-containing protein n=1 Tax=Paramicrobacterium agarici TaxID=630514 RepID=UPI001154035B